jgi:hypothetical protein
MKPRKPREPRKPIQPMKPRKPREPRKPIQPMNHRKPMKPRKPREPRKPIQLMKHRKPRDPVKPRKPMQPMTPCPGAAMLRARIPEEADSQQPGLHCQVGACTALHCIFRGMNVPAGRKVIRMSHCTALHFTALHCTTLHCIGAATPVTGSLTHYIQVTQ